MPSKPPRPNSDLGGDWGDGAAQSLDKIRLALKKRRSSRSRLPTKLQIQVGYQTWVMFRMAFQSDLKRERVSLVLEGQPPLGHSVELTIKLPNDVVVSMPAKVALVRALNDGNWNVTLDFDTKSSAHADAAQQLQSAHDADFVDW